MNLAAPIPSPVTKSGIVPEPESATPETSVPCSRNDCPKKLP